MSEAEREPTFRDLLSLLLFPTLIVVGGGLGSKVSADPAQVDTLVGMIVGGVLWLLLAVAMTPGPKRPKPDPHPKPEDVP